MPKNNVKVLLLENIHPKAVERFRQAGYSRIEILKGALSEKELINKLTNVEVLGIRSKTKISTSILNQFKDQLLTIGCFCIGTNQVDIKAATDMGVNVFNSPYSNTRSVAELVIGATIMLIRNILEKNEATHKGVWLKNAEGSYELRGKTIGIVGYGNIGTQLSILAEGMGMKVIFYDTQPKLPLGNARACATLKALLQEADVVTLHTPSTPQTKNLINKTNISFFKQDAILINYSRGDNVDMEVLGTALRNKKLKGVAIDVFAEEPETTGDKFVTQLQGIPNVLLTPHIAGSTEEAQTNIAVDVSNKLIQYIETGRSLSSCNLPELEMSATENTHRIVHLHANTPGVLSQINQVMSQNNINILAQSLKTNEKTGYVILDVDKKPFRKGYWFFEKNPKHDSYTHFILNVHLLLFHTLMQIKLSSLLNRFAESDTLKMAKLTRELRAQGKDIVDLSVGEPDFNTPEYIKDAALQALKENWTHYSPVAGYLDLRQAICQKLKDENQLDYTPDQIVVSTGAKQSIANLLMSLVENGDEVIIPSPYWVSYSELVKMTGAQPVIFPTQMKNDFKITPEELESIITPQTKLIMYSSPSNPTGSMYSKSELKALASVLAKHPQVLIMSDEIYEYINYVGEHASIAQVEGMKERTIIVNGFSKGFAMTGWRMGYIAAPKSIAQACEKIQGQITSGANSFAQKACVTTLAANREESKKMTASFKQRRDLVMGLIQQIPDMECNMPDGAFYVFPKVSAYFGKKTPGGITINDATDLAMYFLSDANVSGVAGNSFGNKNHIRFSYANSESNLKKGFQQIGEALMKLK